MTSTNGPVSLRPAPIAPSTIEPPSQPQPVELKSTACTTCTRRKVKCDKTHPCSTCRVGRFVCEYSNPAPRKRKRKDYEELQERLDRYEHLLKENGILAAQEVLPDKTPSSQYRDSLKVSASQNQSPSIPPTPVPSSGNGILLPGPGPGQTRYVESHIWKDLGEDLRSSDDDDEDMAESAPTPINGPTAHPSPANMIAAGAFGASLPAYNFTELHPSPADSRKLWQVYLRNIDPLIKIVHRPTTTALIETAATNTASLSKESECLLFGIYHFALTAMSDEDKEGMFGTSWPDILKRYHDTTQQALIGCSFFQTTSMTVLQAFLLLLISVRFKYNPHTFWILSGIAVRLAQRMGLHSDSDQTLSPFDVQMRRRVWWYVLMGDNFAASQAGTTVATIPADFWDAPKPLNINDDDIWPGMTEAPEEKNEATDMIIFLVRVEITAFRAKLGQSMAQNGPKEIEALLKQLEDKIESKFIRYCDVTDPAHYLIMVGSRAAMLNARLRARLTRLKAGTATAAERGETFAIALKLLDHDAAMTSSPLVARYAWQWQAFFSWEPLICALKEMCQEQDPVLMASAWDKVGRVYAGHPNIVTPKRSIEIALGRLTLRAWELTERRTASSIPVPACVTSLREKFKKRTHWHWSADVDKTTEDSTTPGTLSTAPLVPAEIRNGELSLPDIPMWDDMNVDSVDIDWKFWDALIHDSEMQGRS